MRSRALFTVLVAALLWSTGLRAAAADGAQPAAPTVLRSLAAVPTAPDGMSEPVEAPILFSLVGFRAPASVELRVRTSLDGRTWSDWQTVEALPPDEGPDPGSVEPALPSDGLVHTAPLWTGPARWLQVDGADPGDGSVVPVVIDSLGQSRSLPARAWDAVRAAWRGEHAVALIQQPQIVSRAGWGADERLRSGTPSYSRRVRAGFVHHTVNANDYTAEEAPALVRGIYRYHTSSLGWNDIGYNLLVDRFGTVYEGRAGGLEAGVIGAHAGGFNTSTFGVASLGTHSSAGPSPEALESIARVIAWKFDVHHIDVAGSVELRSRGSSRYADGRVVRLPTVSGHRAVSATSCPGDALDSLLPAIRHRVLELGGAMILDHDASPQRVTVARGRPLEGPVRFSARLRPAGEWSLEVRDPNGIVVHRDSGQGETVSSTWSPPQAGALLGRYDWTLSSPGRRDAVEYVEFVLPEIEDITATGGVLRGGQAGRFAAPLRVGADLWPQAVWTLTVTDPAGDEVHRAAGVGDRVDAEWTGRAGLEPGRYRWLLEADDAEPVSGDFEVLWPVLERAGVADDAVGGSVALSRLAFGAGEAAHAVLARADLFADAMAGGPLAGSDGPVLLTASDRLDPRVRAELQRVLPDGAPVYLLGGESALAPEVAAALDDWDVVRLSGAGRAETAARVAREVLAASGSERVLLARGGPDSAVPWADALAGGAYGAWAGVPVLLTDGGRLSPAVAALLAARDIEEVIVLGGPGAIADEVLDALPDPRRVSGADRAGTAAAVAEQLWGRTAARDGDALIVANGYTADAWSLALAASPLAARQEAPLLLVAADGLPPATREHLERLDYRPERPGDGWLLGGEARVGQAAADEVMRRLQ